MESLLFLLLLAFACFLLFKGSRFRKWLIGLSLVLLSLGALWARLWESTTAQPAKVNAQFFSGIPRQGRPDGYVSSDQCQACHPSQYNSWHQTYHRTMTQWATPESVVGDFENVTLELLGKTYHLERRGDEFWVELEDQDWEYDPRSKGQSALLVTPPRVKKRIGLLTGSHHMQNYWLPSRWGNMQLIFPFAWLIEDQRWAPFHQTFLRDPALPPSRHIWNSNCIGCHSTGGQPGENPSTHLLDTRSGELSIGCEACHGPAEEHVRANRAPLRRYRSHAAQQGDPTILNPRRQAAKVSAQVCGQCHGIKWVPDSAEWRRIGFRYRPGQDLSQTAPIVQPTRLEAQPWLKQPLEAEPNFLAQHYWPDGMVRVSGRDYNGLIESPCYQRGELTCLSCHSMHQSHPSDQLAANMQGNRACLQCHQKLPNDITVHSHHQAESAGSQCYNCHMPYTTYGVLKAIRSHQISSPTVKSSQETGRPNACNLCHLDQTLGWTAAHLADWYGQPQPPLSAEDQSTSAAVRWLLSGDAGQRALVAWSMGWPAARTAAGENWLAPFLAQLLDDPYSAVRYIAARSLKRLPGFQDFPYDFAGAAEERRRAPQRALDRWKNGLANQLDRAGPQILIDRTGALQQEQLARLRQQRNDRSMDLRE